MVFSKDLKKVYYFYSYDYRAWAQGRLLPLCPETWQLSVMTACRWQGNFPLPHSLTEIQSLWTLVTTMISQHADAAYLPLNVKLQISGAQIPLSSSRFPGWSMAAALASVFEFIVQFMLFKVKQAKKKTLERREVKVNPNEPLVSRVIWRRAPSTLKEDSDKHVHFIISLTAATSERKGWYWLTVWLRVAGAWGGCHMAPHSTELPRAAERWQPVTLSSSGGNGEGNAASGEGRDCRRTGVLYGSPWGPSLFRGRVQYTHHEELMPFKSFFRTGTGTNSSVASILLDYGKL